MDFLQIKTKTGGISTTKLNAQSNIDLKNTIWNLTSFLPEDWSVARRIYCIENNITEIPRCSITGEPLKWNANKRHFSPSRQSSVKSRTINSNSIKQRYKNIYNIFHEKYISNSYILIDKENILSLYTFNKNIKAWDIEKNYDLFCSIKKHTDFLLDNSNWGERIYCIKHNIVERPVSVDGGFKKYINSNLGYSKYSTKSNKHIMDLNVVIDYINAEGFESIDSLYKIQDQKSIKIKCKECGTEKQQIITCAHWKKITCNRCTGTNRSRPENDIVKFLQNIGINNIKTNFKFKDNNYEVDIYLPNEQIAIEYHGILWHSFGLSYPANYTNESKNKYKHRDKYLLCNKNGVQLIQIFENEWLKKQDIVKSIIKSKCGLSRKIYARKCQFRHLTKIEKSAFFDTNHLQGNSQSCIDVGLIYNNEIVAAMSFSNRILKDKSQIELVRFSNKLDTSVIGGFTKLLKNSKICKDIISYCDLRYGNGNVYREAGFKFIRVSPPNHFYTLDNMYLQSRYKFQKHKLQSFENFSKDKTETQIMYEAGYRKIYDAGNLVFIYSKM
jgi:hypothetical protein